MSAFGRKRATFAPKRRAFEQFWALFGGEVSRLNNSSLAVLLLGYCVNGWDINAHSIIIQLRFMFSLSLVSEAKLLAKNLTLTQQHGAKKVTFYGLTPAAFATNGDSRWRVWRALFCVLWIVFRLFDCWFFGKEKQHKKMYIYHKGHEEHEEIGRGYFNIFLTKLRFSRILPRLLGW